jgi:hypothetical protein
MTISASGGENIGMSFVPVFGSVQDSAKADAPSGPSNVTLQANQASKVLPAIISTNRAGFAGGG